MKPYAVRAMLLVLVVSTSVLAHKDRKLLQGSRGGTDIMSGTAGRNMLDTGGPDGGGPGGGGGGGGHPKPHGHYPPKVYHPKVHYPVYKPVYKPAQIYYCLYFYYQYGYYPVDWHVHMKEAVDDYQKTYGVVYGCSFSDVPEHYGYNWGYSQYPDSKGGYICFKYETSPDDFWGWLYSHPKYAQMGFASYKSDYCHYKVDTLYTLPKCEYTY